ncbi:MAG: Calx-beta domain-containing protein [Microcystaceae cyanobacterium]
MAGDVHLKSSYDVSDGTNGFQNSPGKHGYMSLIHEIGHTLGLKHPQDSSPTLPAAEDNTTNTVMTYNFTGASAGTLMPYDIKALQYLYGAKDNNLGDNTYQFTKVDQFSLNGQLSLNTTASTKQTIWDSGGVDTLDFTNLSANSSGYRFDLNPGGILTTKTAYNGTSYSKNSVSYKTTTFGTAIAYNVFIENLVNSTSNDEIFANSTANRFSGYNSLRSTGNDIFWNTNTQDTLDLSGYSFSAVTQTQNGNDLILGLGSKGSISVKNYYAGEKLNLLFSDSLTLAIDDITFQEGNSGTTTALFTVALSSSSTQTVTVAYSTSDGTATAGQDYISTNGILSFAPGEVSKAIAVAITNDSIYEPNAETFFLNLSNAQNATISNSQGVGTIIDNDTLPTISINNVSRQEGSSKSSTSTTSFQFTANLSNASSQTVSVQYATANNTAIAGSDYISTNGTLTFNPGEISKTLTVKVYADKTAESNESFLVNLTNPTNATIGDTQGIGTIMNDDGTPTSISPPSKPSNSLLAAEQDRLTGIDSKQSIIIDRLNGSNFSDSFVLGDSHQAYYTQAGVNDYALITDFNANQGDVIQLHGIAASGSLPAGEAIFHKTNGGEELIGMANTLPTLPDSLLPFV